MYETESLACKFIHQSPIKLLAHLPIFYKCSAMSSTKHPEITYGLSRQLKKTVPSVSSQTQEEGVHKTPWEPCVFPRRGWYNESRVQIKYSNIHLFLPHLNTYTLHMYSIYIKYLCVYIHTHTHIHTYTYIYPKSTLSVFEHLKS